MGSFYHRCLDLDGVKVITGPRRCGKTYLALLGLKERTYSYVNFDDEILARIPTDELHIINEVIIGEFGHPDVLVLDEIQNVDGWELYVNRLSRTGQNLVITGSNSRLLSTELATHLTGRTVTIPLLPFSFMEYLTSRGVTPDTLTDAGVGEVRAHLEEYLSTGGFPEVVLSIPDDDLRKAYLGELFNAIIWRDIIQRVEVRYPRELAEMASTVSMNFSRRTSNRKLAKEWGISDHTVRNYLHALVESHLLLASRRYSHKPRESEGSIRKYYSIDTGLITHRFNQPGRDRGFILENCVAIELVRRGIELHYFLASGRYEVDFIVRNKGRPSEVIQVCWDPSGVPSREITSGVNACRELEITDLTIITWFHHDRKVEGGITITHIPLWKWLLDG